MYSLFAKLISIKNPMSASKDDIPINIKRIVFGLMPKSSNL